MPATCPNFVISVENAFLVDVRILCDQIVDVNCCNRVSVIIMIERMVRQTYTRLRPFEKPARITGPTQTWRSCSTAAIEKRIQRVVGLEQLSYWRLRPIMRSWIDPSFSEPGYSVSNATVSCCPAVANRAERQMLHQIIPTHRPAMPESPLPVPRSVAVPSSGR